MITATQLVLHLVGDYVIQSDWMAQTKTKSSIPALAHVITYTLPFALITQNPWSLFLILATHFVIDRFRLARYVCWFKNQIFSPSKGDWKYTLQEALDSGTGYKKDSPAFLSVWLMIICDNTMHLICNGLILHYLG